MIGRPDVLNRLYELSASAADADTYAEICDLLDIDEYNQTPAKVNIVPNPNNGQMHIDFENMEGRTAIKVFDMTGNQIDAFETIINTNRYYYDYNMKKYAEGIYFFVISNNNRVLTKKVVVIH